MCECSHHHRRCHANTHPHRPAFKSAAIQAKNASFVLPADLVAFLEFTNGLRVQWSAQCLQKEVVVGTFSINSLRNITRLPVDSLGSPPREQRNHVVDARSLPVPCAAYLIDQHPKVRRGWLDLGHRARKGSQNNLGVGVSSGGRVRSAVASSCRARHRHPPCVALAAPHSLPGGTGRPRVLTLGQQPRARAVRALGRGERERERDRGARARRRVVLRHGRTLALAGRLVRLVLPPHGRPPR